MSLHECNMTNSAEDCFEKYLLLIHSHNLNKWWEILMYAINSQQTQLEDHMKWLNQLDYVSRVKGQVFLYDIWHIKAPFPVHSIPYLSRLEKKAWQTSSSQIFIWKARGHTQYAVSIQSARFMQQKPKALQSRVFSIPYTFVIVSVKWHRVPIQYLTTQHKPGFEQYQIAWMLSSWQFGTIFLDNVNTAIVMFCPCHCQSK